MPSEVDVNQMIVGEFVQFQQAGVKVFDPQKIAEASLVFPLVVATYHYLTKESVRKELKDVKVLTGPNHKLEFYRVGKKFLEISDIDVRRATFKVNGRLFDLKKIYTMEDLAREVGRSISEKTESAVLYDWLMPRAEAIGPALLAAAVAVKSIVSFVIGVVVPLSALAIPTLFLYNDITMRSGIKGCIKTITELIQNASITVVNTVKSCKDPEIKLEPKAVPRITKKVILQSPEANIQVMTPEKISLLYVDTFERENFRRQDDYCKTVILSLAQDLDEENPTSDRAKILQKNIAKLPNADEAKVEDRQCVKEKMQAAGTGSSPAGKKAAKSNSKARPDAR